MKAQKNNNPVINTSVRGHGKWGDFLVALIPLSWCGNILINSNYILRMTEWQNEESLFTIRIQGKQWYWVYKYNFDTIYKLKSVYKNIGNNNWCSIHIDDFYMSRVFNSISLLSYDLEFSRSFSNLLLKNIKNKKYLNLYNLNSQFYRYFDIFNLKKKHICGININFKLLNLKLIKKINNLISSNMNTNLSEKKFIYNAEFFFINSDNTLVNTNTDFTKNTTKYENTVIDETDETSSSLRLHNNFLNIILLKGLLNKNNISILQNIKKLKTNLLLNVKLSGKSISSKIYQTENFWGFKQKKYKKLKSFNIINSYKYTKNKYSIIKNIKKNDLLESNNFSFYNSIKNNKYRSEIIPIALSKRLLRVKRTLVLPAHVNLTLITNSYDVVHSWFIPGLGLKIDCVPGRSTHHSLYIDNVGIYYGQCAEICGRYHHHMPIRVSVILFKNFLIWWKIKGMHRICRLDDLKKKKSKLLNKF